MVTSARPLMQEQVSLVEQVLNVKQDEAEMMLLQTKFKTEELIQQVMNEQKYSFCVEVERKPMECTICCEMKTCFLLRCTHSGCRECFREYIKTQLQNNEIEKLRCMDMDCNNYLTRSFIDKIDIELATRYDQLYLNQFINASLHLKYCVKCNQIIQLNTSLNVYTHPSIIPIVQCRNCSIQFCFNCSLQNHLPIPCGVLKSWLKKCMDDSETANWIHANTKECPKCNSMIEKNGGCNHMVCKRCTYEFCWVCLGPWAEHGTQWYNCSRYDENSSVEARDHQADSRAALERYLFYFNRYANHEQSLKLDKELYEKTEKKMEEMQQQSSLSWIDVQYMRQAVDILGKARTILK